MDLSGYSLPVISGAVTFTGLVVVFMALLGLWALVALFGRFFTSASKPKAPARPTAPAPKVPVPQAASQNVKPAMRVEDGINDEVVAVIAAAVAAMNGGAAVAIRGVRRAKEARPSWAQAGLMQNTQPF